MNSPDRRQLYKNIPNTDNNDGLLHSLSSIVAATTKVVNVAGEKSLHAVNVAGGIGKNVVLTGADAVGLKDKVEAAGN